MDNLFEVFDEFIKYLKLKILFVEFQKIGEK